MEPEKKKVLVENRTKIAESVENIEIVKPLLMKFKIFNKLMWRDIHTVSDVLDLLPSRGPEAFTKFIEVLKRANYVEEAEILENPIISLKFPSNMLYKMSSKKLGYCLIINNVKFDNLNFKERLGSDKDAESLKIFFENIDYDVAVESNMKAIKMHERLEEFSKSDFQYVDSSIVIILSHGDQVNNQDVYAGKDAYKNERGILCNVVSKNSIIKLFNNKNCKKLIGKPKVFIFVACRGKEKDYRVPYFVLAESADNIENINCDNIENVETATTQEMCPTFGDMFMIYSCLPDYISMRDHDEGSWFCQDLVSVLQDCHCKHDLVTMVETVNSKLMKRVSNLLRVTQAAHFESFGVIKKLMLCRLPSN